MARRLFTLLSALSLLLFVAVMAVWAMSHWRAVQLWYVEPAGAYTNGRGRPYREGGIEVLRGHLVWADELRPGRPRGEWKTELAAGRPLLRHGGPLGFRFEAAPTPAGSSRVIATPLWPWAAASAAAPALWLVRWRRRRGPPPGHCRTCGYDLRATPGKCPECGAVPAAKEA